MVDDSESIGAQLTSTRIEMGARWSVEDVFSQMVRAHSLEPHRYTDEAVHTRADRDIAHDLAHDIDLGFHHTAEQAESYRQRYRAAYLLAWRDRALWRECQERYRPNGYVIVCMR